MTRRIYCLECNAVVGEERERGEGDRGDRLDVCQTCAQHRSRSGALEEPAAAFLDFWRWLSGSGA